MKTKKIIIYIIILTILFGIIGWINCIPINLFLGESILFICGYAFFLGLGIILIESMTSIHDLFLGNRMYVDRKIVKIGGFIILGPIVYFLIISLLGIPILHTDAYKEQIGEIEVKEFTSEIQAMDTNQLLVVDIELATKLADKKLGEKPALGSQVKLGEPTIQNVNGKLEWVVPLEHSGVFKWLSNLEGTPGYIIVSATDSKDVTYVEDYKIKYQPGSFLTQNLERHIRFGKGITKGLTDYSFELNDEGRPYWVVTTYHNTRFLNLPEATGVIIVDAQTGEQKEYKIEEVPEWVDRIQPRSFIKQQINNRGEYINGIFNFSNKDKFKTSGESAVVYNNGSCYMITGITSIASDEATTGFMMINLKTKEVVQYNIGGATEEAAQKSAEGKVQNMGYQATYPIVVNVNGIPTYFMTLKDKSGLVKQYAFVSIQDYTTVGNGENAEDALKSYQQMIRDGKNPNIEDAIQQKETTGTIERIAQERNNQTTVYKIITQEESNKIYKIAFDVSEELAITQKGDKVKLTYYETENKIIDSISFDNLEYEQK